MRREAPVSFPWTAELLKGVWRKLILTPEIVQGKDTRDYFSELSVEDYRDRHTAAGDPVLGEYLRRSGVLAAYQGRNGLNVYDLGTGCGDFYTIVRLPRDSHIVLVDFVPRVLEITSKLLKRSLSSVECIVADLRTWKAPAEAADLVVCINVLPYVQTLSRFFDTVATLLRQGGHLCLVYPLQSPAWEDKFGGIQIAFHRPSDVQQYVERIGLRCVEDCDVRFAVPGTFGLMSFSVAKFCVYIK